MNFKLSFFLFLVFVSASIVAQKNPCTLSISGKILDAETKAPIPYVTVRISDTEKYDITDQNGLYAIEGVCSETNTLIISCLGYSESQHEHHHDHGTSPHIYLTPTIVGLDEVTIRAEKNKDKGTESIAQVTVNKAEIASKPTQTLASVLSSQQGVTLASTGTNVELPVIHGLSGNRILILNNGLKHGFQSWGREHAPEIDVNSANSITVVKGAAGVRYGPEALGGAVIVESNPLLLDNPLYATIGTGYQTNGRGYNANLEIGQGSDKWSYYVNGSYIRIGDRKTPDYNLTNSGREEKAFGFGVLRHLDNWDFKINYSYIDQNLALLRSSIASSAETFIRSINADEPLIINPFSYDISQPNQEVQHHLAKAEISWWYSDDAKLTFRGGVQLNKRDEFDVRRNSELPIIDLDLLTYDYQLEWQHPRWYGLDGLVGVQYFSQNNDNNPGTQTTPLVPNYNIERYSAFITESLGFGKNTFEAGVRVDFEYNDVRGRETNQDIFRDNYSFTNLTTSLGYIRRFNESSTFRTNLGTAWRTPNVFELFSFGQQRYESIFGLLRFSNTDGTPSTSEVTLFADSDVEPERGYKFINEFETYKNGNQHNITVYSHFIENYVFDRPIGVFGTVRGPNTAFFFDQVDALFLGADYTWRREWTDDITGIFGFSYLWTTTFNQEGDLINQPPISTNYELQWNLGKLWEFESSSLTIRPSYTFRQFQAPRTIPLESLADGSVQITTESEIFDFTDPPDGYFLLDISWNVKWKEFNANIAVTNLLNARYRNYLNDLRYFADEPGRNILFTLNYSFKSKKND